MPVTIAGRGTRSFVRYPPLSVSHVCEVTFSTLYLQGSRLDVAVVQEQFILIVIFAVLHSLVVIKGIIVQIEVVSLFLFGNIIWLRLAILSMLPVGITVVPKIDFAPGLHHHRLGIVGQSYVPIIHEINVHSYYVGYMT